MTDPSGKVPSPRSPDIDLSLVRPESPPPLNSAKVAHLYPGRCVVVARDVADLRADSLQVIETGPNSVTYRSIHGGTISATNEIFLLLDTVLEKTLPAVLPPPANRGATTGRNEAPATPGPYGSGNRALGSLGDQLFLGDFDVPTHDDGFRWERFAHDNATCESGGSRAWTVSDVDGPHDREPWCEAFGCHIVLRSWLMHEMCWTTYDGDYTDYPGTDEEHRRFVDTQISRMQLAEDLLTAFPQDRSRYFFGAHAGWDPWWEDCLSRDQVFGFASDTEVAVLWMRLCHYYG